MEAAVWDVEGVAEGIRPDDLDHANVACSELWCPGAEQFSLFVEALVALVFGEDYEHSMVPGYGRFCFALGGWAGGWACFLRAFAGFGLLRGAAGCAG